ncbi:hypothetical protein ACFE04_028866 [Oxalis oulophora]
MALSMEAWAFAFGILGNIISFLVGLAPLPTFYQIYKKKTAQGFQSIPYVVALFSAMLWIYYALVKNHDSILLYTINTFFVIIETVYISVYLYYAPKKERIVTVKLFLLFNVFGFGTICLGTQFFAHGETRLRVLGYICMAFALSVFAAPLCIVVPNTLGFVFGIFQMALYMMYKNAKKVLDQAEPKIIQELQEHIVDVMKLSSIVCTSDLDSVVIPVINANEDQVLLIEDPTAYNLIITEEEVKQVKV